MQGNAIEIEKPVSIYHQAKTKFLYQFVIIVHDMEQN